MRYTACIALAIILLFTSCGGGHHEMPALTTATAATTSTTTASTTTTAAAHSPLYHDAFAVEDVIRWFNEVCLDAEFVNSGDATVLQKWTQPIRYTINGNPTDDDLATLMRFVDRLNAVEGFPGMYETTDIGDTDMNIHFCSQDKMIAMLGDNFSGMDGGVTFWYNGDNEIYNAVICCRNDLDQTVRNTVIMEEIYNGLGPVQDTALRPDSIIAAEYSTPQELTAADELIIKLLYHPQMRCGMTADECEAVIRSLYY